MLGLPSAGVSAGVPVIGASARSGLVEAGRVIDAGVVVETAVSVAKTTIAVASIDATLLGNQGLLAFDPGMAHLLAVGTLDADPTIVSAHWASKSARILGKGGTHNHEALSILWTHGPRRRSYGR